MVNPARVADILSRLSNPGDIRNSPRADDLPGDFDGWFDGGAYKEVTGSTTYVFQDDTKAVVGVHPWLSILIKFADGSEVQVLERTPVA